MVVKHFVLPAVGLIVGGVAGYLVSTKVKERRMLNYMDISEVEAFCKRHGDCDSCPLLDKTADMCSLHCEIPAEWDNQNIAAIIRKEDRNGNKTEA